MELVSQMCWAPIRMNLKGLQNENVLCSMRIWTQSPNMWKIKTKFSLSGTGAVTQKGAHILTPPPALLKILSRPAFYLSCVVKYPVMKLPLWWLLLKRTQSVCSQTFGGDPVKSESWRRILITAFCNSLTYFAILLRTAASASPNCCTIS